MRGAGETARVILWGAWYGSHNVGDQALLIAIARILEHRAGPVALTVLTDDVAHVESYAGAESGVPVSALSSRSRPGALIRAFASADLFVIGGGVPFFEDRRHLAVMRALVTLARFTRTPYMTWAASSQRVDSDAARRVFRRLLAGAGGVTCRDRVTRDLFSACGFTGPIELVADPVFSFAAEPERMRPVGPKWLGERDPDRPLAALIPRAIRARDRLSGRHYAAQTPADVERMIACFAAAVDWIWERGCQPAFIPMNTVAPDDDREAARAVIRLARRGDRALLVDEAIRPLAVPPLLSRCDFTLTARVHGSILSMVANRPMAMYGFDVKHRGIMESMQRADFLIDAAAADPVQTQAMLAKLAEDLPGQRRTMAEARERLAESAEAPGRIARRLIRGG